MTQVWRKKLVQAKEVRAHLERQPIPVRQELDMFAFLLARATVSQALYHDPRFDDWDIDRINHWADQETLRLYHINRDRAWAAAGLPPYNPTEDIRP